MSRDQHIHRANRFSLGLKLSPQATVRPGRGLVKPSNFKVYSLDVESRPSAPLAEIRGESAQPDYCHS